MIERRTGPVHGAVTERAILGEACCHVVGIRGPPHVLQVARYAGRADIRKLIVRMTGRARHRDMAAHQGELREVVIKVRSGPACRVVALCAVLRESGSYVVRIRAVGKVLHMATETIGGRALKPPVGVAAGACQCLMHSRQGETGKAGVIEPGHLPLRNVVAVLAGSGKACCPMVHHPRLKVLGMAAEALRAQPRINTGRSALMTGIARGRRVCAQERETIPMVANGLSIRAPAEHRVAVLALSAELPLVEISVTVCALRARL